jgi:hypothetical protein
MTLHRIHDLGDEIRSGKDVEHPSSYERRVEHIDKGGK